MRTKTMFMIIFIVILFSISHCNGDTCYCTCCAGNSCTPTLQGTITVSSCASSSCESVCQSKYPTQCTDGSGSTIYQCKSGGGGTTPNWAGVFKMENRCDTRTCCCPIGELVLSPMGANMLRAQCQFGGQCPSGSSSIDQTISMPTGFSGQLTFMGNLIQVTLSQDSRSIVFNNPVFPSCTETATRNNALSTATINLALVFLLSGLMSFRQFMV